MASGHEDQPECKQMQLDTKSVIKDILAMTLTRVNLLKSDIPSGNSETSISATPENKWGDRKIVYVSSNTRKKQFGKWQEYYNPVYVSISSY